jgi:hypothetical protein
MSEELKKEWEEDLAFNFTFLHEIKHDKLGDAYDRVKSFISFLLAKQQEEFVKMIKNRTGVIAYADTDKGTVERILISRDDLLADIKSKLK